MNGRRYDRRGYLAINPKAFFDMFFARAEKAPSIAGDCSVIEVVGPLDHHAGWCDSYDSIHDQVSKACVEAPTTIVLKIDSPGGDVSGCFDTARELRAMCAAAGKRLVTFVDGMACSAAYALACAGDTIFVPPTGFVGSIGVLHARLDATSLDAAMGMRIALTTSGARKADGNPHTVITDAELAETQRTVNALAGEFFALVEELRGGKVSASAVEALEARVLHGREAVTAGLADQVASFDQMLAVLAGNGASMSKYEEARAALAEAAEGDGEEAKKAKRALAAMDGEPDDDEKPKDEASAEESEGDEKPKDEAKAVSAATAASLAAKLSALSADVKALKAEKEGVERAAFLASRPDLGGELVKVLESKPLAEVKAIVGAIPKPTIPNQAPAATATVQPTRGETQDTPVLSAQSDAAREMDARMGITRYEMGVRHEGNSQVFGVKPVNTAPNAGKDGAK